MVRPGMSDGRCFTDYMPSCQSNAMLMKTMKIDDNNAFRKHLQDNAIQFMKTSQKSCMNQFIPLKQKDNSK